MLNFNASKKTRLMAAVALAAFLPLAAQAAVVKPSRGAKPPAPLPATVIKNTTGTTPAPTVIVPACARAAISPC